MSPQYYVLAGNGLPTGYEIKRKSSISKIEFNDLALISVVNLVMLATQTYNPWHIQNPVIFKSWAVFRYLPDTL